MARTAQRDPRSRARTQVVGAVLAVILVLGLGIAIGRATAPPSQAEPPPTPGSEPTEPDSPGPSRTEAGVPTGYAHTETGAVTAASQYTAALGSKLLLDPEERQAAFDVITLPEGRDDVERLADTADLFADRLTLTQDLLDGPGFVYETYPVGWRVTSYRDDEAVVEVWNTGLFIAPAREAFMSPWNTATYTLRWEDDDWRIASLATSDGPTPPIGQASDNELVGDEINAFHRYHYLPAE